MSCPHCSGPIHDLGKLIAFYTTSEEIYASQPTYEEAADNLLCKLAVRSEAQVPVFVAELWRTFCCFLAPASFKGTMQGEGTMKWTNKNRVLTATHYMKTVTISYQVGDVVTESATFSVDGQYINAPGPVLTLGALYARFDATTQRMASLLNGSN